MYESCRQAIKYLLLLFLLGTGLAGSLAAQSGKVTAARPAEFMIYQYPDISLVIKIDVPEAEFDVQITGPERALLLDSAVEHRRLGPIFQFVSSVDTARQLMIKINPDRAIDRSRISMELIQLSSRDRNARMLAEAYQLFSSGTERMHSKDTSTWTIKVYSLRSAAQVFSEFGMEEMRLWSEYYAAHLVLFRLNDVLTALELTDHIQISANKAGFEQVELAALSLQTEALMMAAQKSKDERSSAYYQRAHISLQRQAALAASLGLNSERGRALYTDGLAFERQGNPESAIQRYQQALDISLSSGNLDLVNEIRATAAAAYERQGSTSGAIAMLDDIAGDLGGPRSMGLEESEELELAENLFEKGRLLNNSYRFAEAATELLRALQIQRSVPGSRSWGPTGLELAWSRFSAGQWEEAERITRESLPRTVRAGNEGILYRAFGSLAVIARSRSEFERVDQIRAQQSELPIRQHQRAGLLYEQGVDALSRGRPGMGDALSRLRASREAANATGDHLVSARADIQLCLLQIERSGKGACTEANVKSQLITLRNSGIPRLGVEADYALMKLQRSSGRAGQSEQTADRLVSEVTMLQSDLPGVLGAWYWENRVHIMRDYLSLMLNRTLGNSRDSTDGDRMLLALERTRNLEDEDSLINNSPAVQHEAMRASLSKLELDRGGSSKQLAQQVNRQLKSLATQNGADPVVSTGSGLRAMLGQLDRNSSVLTYYFADNAAYALLGRRNGVRVTRLPSPRDLPGQLESLSSLVARPDGQPFAGALEQIGSALLEPLAGQLTDRIYLLAAGPLNGIPFDALRVRGDFLARNHQLIFLRSLAALENSSLELELAASDGIFLAGDPQTSQDLFSYGVSTSAEIGAVRDRFIGPGLHIVQGVALQADEFRDERFRKARLIHLAMPGVSDPVAPELSRLSLSHSPQEGVRTYLLPADVRGFDYAAGLAVLSNLAIVGEGSSLFSNRLGFTSDFLDAGVAAVLMALSSAGDAESAEFMGEFYDHLAESNDVADALRRTRLSRMDGGDDTIFPTWARFQLHIR